MSKKILLHSCCAPCTTYVHKWLKDNDFEIVSYFYNPNIYPVEEFNKRLDTMKQYSDEVGLKLIVPNNYETAVSSYNSKVGPRSGDERCLGCYDLRFNEVAKFAAQEKFDYFTSTLLISPYQKHDLIKQTGLVMQKNFDIPFFYQDFRVGYRESRQISKDMGLYRQKYCGCDYSLIEKK